MKIALTYPRISAGLAAGAIVGLFLSGVAYAVTSANFTYSAPQQGWITIHPMALAADADVRTYLIGYEPGTLNGSGCFQTGLNPPQGAKITSVDVWYSSQSEGDLQFRIYRHNLNTGAGGLVLVKNSTDTTGGAFRKAIRSARLSGRSAKFSCTDLRSAPAPTCQPFTAPVSITPTQAPAIERGSKSELGSLEHGR